MERMHGRVCIHDADENESRQFERPLLQYLALAAKQTEDMMTVMQESVAAECKAPACQQQSSIRPLQEGPEGATVSRPHPISRSPSCTLSSRHAVLQAGLVFEAQEYASNRWPHPSDLCRVTPCKSSWIGPDQQPNS